MTESSAEKERLKLRDWFKPLLDDRGAGDAQT